MGQPLTALHEEPVVTEFEPAGFGSWALLLLSHLSVLVVPIVIGFAMGNFWITVDTVVVDHPKMVYTGRVMMRAVTADGDEYLWTSQPYLAEQLLGDNRATKPFFSVLKDDADRDGNAETFVFSGRIPLRSPQHKIVLFQLLPAFSYTLEADNLYLEMESAPFVTYQGVATLSSSCLVIDGHAPFKQRLLLRADSWYRYDVVYRRSYMMNKDDTTQTILYDAGNVVDPPLSNDERYYNPADELDIADLTDMAGVFAQRYNARNESTPFELDTAYFTAATSIDCKPAAISPPSSTLSSLSSFDPQVENHAFSFHATIRVPPASVQYVPTLASNLKRAWVQYFAIAYVIHWVFLRLRRLFATSAFVTTNARLVRPNFFYST